MVAFAFFAIASAVVIYVLFGYPILLSVMARRRSQPVLKGLAGRTVTVLLPVRNGERWIARKLDAIMALNYPRELVDVIVMSDGSTDATADIARSYADRRVS